MRNSKWKAVVNDWSDTFCFCQELILWCAKPHSSHSLSTSDLKLIIKVALKCAPVAKYQGYDNIFTAATVFTSSTNANWRCYFEWVHANWKEPRKCQSLACKLWFYFCDSIDWICEQAAGRSAKVVVIALSATRTTTAVFILRCMQIYFMFRQWKSIGLIE